MQLSIYKNPITGFTLLLIYAFFFWLMLKITLQYIPFRLDVAFLQIKQDYIHLPIFNIAFFIHVFSAIFVLLAGFTQFSPKFRAAFPKVHRNMGRIYVFVTMLLVGPSGLILGIYANGGVSSKIAFCMLAILWIFFTWMAFIKILKRNIISHRKWMLRSFAMALSAITLRAWKYLIVVTMHPKPMDVYRIVAWLGWTLNLAVAEIIILKLINNENKKPV